MTTNCFDSKSFFSRDSQGLMDTALGKQYPDLVVINANLFNVYTGELCSKRCIIVCGKRIAYVGEGDDFNKGPETFVIDAENKTVIPGLIDGHTHLAWLATPAEFLRYVVKGGTTTIITETMELFPVAGKEGVEDFLSAIANQPIKIVATAPAMSSISKNALGISDKILKEFLLRDDIIGIGESYWQTVLQNPDFFLSAFEQTLKAGKSIEGHSAGAKGRKLAAYTALGVSSCHEPINADQVLERLRNGIYAMVREGSIRSDLSEIASIKDSNIDFRRLCLVSDGVTPDQLIINGYMENILQKAIDAGFDPVDAIKMVTLNVAENFCLSDHIGGIAPGRYADMLIIPDIRTIKPEYVISSGKVVAKDGILQIPPQNHNWNKQWKKSVNLPGKLSASDFVVYINDKDNNSSSSDNDKNKNSNNNNEKSHADIRVIEFVTDLVTKESIISMNLADKKITQDRDRDILKVSAIDRNLSPGTQFTGFVKGFCLKAGAFAATGAWDTSNIIVVGADDKDMAFAVNRIHEVQGGVVVCKEEKVLAELPLPLFGLLSDLPIENIAAKTEKIKKTVRELGSSFDDPLLTLVTLTSAAIPYLRICEQGLVDLKTGESLSLECGSS